MTSPFPRQCCVLTGGLGTRLGTLTEGKPKPMVDVHGRPFLDLVLNFLAQQGISDIILIAAHLGAQVRDHYDGRRIGTAKVRVVIEAKPGGTGGALLAAKEMLDQEFFVTNGDSFFPIDLATLADFSINGPWEARMALRREENMERYGSVILESSRVTRFEEKGGSGPGLMNGGIYMLKHAMLQHIRDVPCSLEHDIFPVLAASKLLHGHVFDGYFIDIGTPPDLARARQEQFLS